MATDNEWLRLIYAQLGGTAPLGNAATETTLASLLAASSGANAGARETTLVNVRDRLLGSPEILDNSSPEYETLSGRPCFRVPSGQLFLFQSAGFTFSTTSTVGNRRIVLEITNGPLSMLIIPAVATQAASQTIRYGYGVGMPAQTYADTNFTYRTQSLPSGFLLTGSNWRLVFYDATSTAFGADTLSNIIATIIRYTL